MLILSRPLQQELEQPNHRVPQFFRAVNQIQHHLFIIKAVPPEVIEMFYSIVKHNKYSFNLN
jgi:hypothetical protein